MQVLAAPDKFRGSIGAAEAAAAIGTGAEAAGASCRRLPLADGGEGTLDVLGGANRASAVAGPLGAPVEAGWRLEGERAVIEMARASGLAIAGGRDANDPLVAATRGTGELILRAIEAGAGRILVAVGGSASTDGGIGAVEVLRDLAPFPAHGIRVEVACDVQTRFVDAARVFAPQKGADAAQVGQLTERLRALAERYRRDLGVDVESLPGAGAAGGLAGGLAALGAELVVGFDLVADLLGLDAALEEADLVITGEGRLDRTSFEGKVVGGVLARAEAAGRPVLVIAGDVEAGVRERVQSVSLRERFGERRAWTETACCIEEAAAALVESVRLASAGRGPESK
ncbi:MAG: glycerate kinase family protein [Gaiellaceae bacterium]